MDAVAGDSVGIGQAALEGYRERLEELVSRRTAAA